MKDIFLFQTLRCIYPVKLLAFVKNIYEQDKCISCSFGFSMKKVLLGKHFHIIALIFWRCTAHVYQGFS